MSKEKRHDMAADNEHEANGSESKSGTKSESRGKLPAWLSVAIRKPRVWKTWIRCMVATFATLVLMLVQPSLNVLGQAAFFGLIMSQIIPPFMAVGLFLIAMITMMVGIAMGWAWGAAAMAAGLQARSQVLLNSQVQREQAGYDSQYNVEAQYQGSIFRGAFLDPRSSAVYGVFLFFGAYFFGFVRAKKPRMMLFAIFGTIILDLMCSFGPLFPIAQYTLAKTLLTPAACYIAIALVSSVLIFPQSLNHIVLTSIVERPLAQQLKMLQLQDRVLATSDPAQWEEIAKETTEGRMELTKGIQEIEGQVKLLQLEVTRGRSSAADVARVFGKLKELGGRMYGLTTFVLLLDERAKSDQRLGADGAQGAYRTKRRVEDFDKIKLEGAEYATLLPMLESATGPLRTAAKEGLEESIHFLNTLNHSRWTSPKNSTPTSVREDNLARLRTELMGFKTKGQFGLLESFKSLFDDRNGQPKESIPALTHAARNLFRCQVFMTTLGSYTGVLVEWLELLLEIEKENPKPAFQFPGGGAKAVVAAANDKEGGGNPLEMGVGDDGSSTDTLVEHEKDGTGKGKGNGTKGKHADPKTTRIYGKDPDAGSPTNAFQKLGRKVHSAWRGVSSPEGIFALKYALVSIALWVPQVAPASAQFVYENRGLWALIMAQTGLGVFTGEQVFSFLSRMIGTVVGLVVGMVVWYIGAARGPGNPFGIAAATMVFIGPFLFLRVNSPPQLQGFFVMIPVTIVFVVGYSWVDSHIYQTANQGVGAGLAGRRALLVIIGFVAGFLIMLFPKPVSAKTRARLSLARIISELGDLYGSEISGFELEIDHKEKDLDVRGRQERYRGQFLKIFARYQATLPQMGFAKFEPGTRGPWPAKEYGKLVKCMGQVINSLALLSGAYGNMDRKWARRLAENADTLHPSFIADTLALFALLHTSLKHAHPLPPTIPLFERLYYHQESKHALRSRSQAGAGAGAGATTAGGSHLNGAKDGSNAVEGRTRRGSKVDREEGEDHVESGEVEMVSALGSAFNFQTLHDEQFAVYATANVALLHLTNALNEMHLVIRELVGEKELEGFQIAQERWAGLERG